MNDDIRHIIESLLFVSETPLSIGRMAEVLELDDLAAVRTAVRKLADEYERRRGGFYLSEVAGGYQLRTRPEHKEWIQRMLQSGPSRLSKAAMETLAIVAYKQPVLRSDVEHIRGVDSGGVLRVLLERKIIKILGRKEMPGRPLLYGTTRKFLEMFNLRDLKDLPTPKELSPEKSGSSNAPEPYGPLFSEPPIEITDDASDIPPENYSDEAPAQLETAGDTPPQDMSSDRPPQAALHPEYLPMIIEKNPAIPTPEPDADQASYPEPSTPQPGKDGAPEKNT